MIEKSVILGEIKFKIYSSEKLMSKNEFKFTQH